MSDEWDFSLLPCLDNRFGDYSLPASDEMVGPQVRAMRWIRSDCREPGGFLDGGAMCRCGFGPYYLKKAPFADRKLPWRRLPEATGRASFRMRSPCGSENGTTRGYKDIMA